MTTPLPVPPPLPTPTITAPAKSPWPGFIIDALISIAVLIITVFGGMVIWGIFKAVQVGMQHPQAAADPNVLAKSIGEPSGVVLMLVSALGMALAALTVYFWRRRATPEERRISRAAAAKPRTWIEAIALGVGLFLTSTALMWSLERIGHLPNPSNMVLLEAVMTYSPALLLLVAVVIAPLSEELLFRRVLFGRLWAAGKPGAGMIASSVLFAFAHEVPGTSGAPWSMTLILLLFYAGMGMSLAWIYRRTGTLWAPIATHATNNLLACGMMIAGYGS